MNESYIERFDRRADRSGDIFWLKPVLTPQAVADEGLFGYAGAEFEFATCPAFCRGVEEAAKKGVFGFTLPYGKYVERTAWWLKAVRDYEAKPEWIVPTHGTIFSLATCIRLFTQPGEAIIMLTPGYHATTHENFTCVIAQAQMESFTRIFGELNASLADSSDRQGSVAVLNPLQHKSSEYAIRFVKQYIKDHIAEDVTIAALANVTGYNADYLARTFRSQTGLTVGQYIINVRMQRIRSLMLDDALSLEDIAQQTGFSSRAYFNRFIKRIAGVSPRTLRLTVQSEENHTPPRKNKE